MILRNPEVRIENCSKCNAHCVLCPREKMTRAKTVMPYEKFEALAFEAKQLGASMISIFGYGEPLLDKGIAKKVSLCTLLDLKTNITTNAALLTEKMSKDLINAGLAQIRFSVHGWGENYEKVHRGLKWEVVSKNIGEFMKLNDVAGHPVEVHVTVIPMHGETVEEIVDRWEPGGSRIRVDYLEVWKPHDWAGAKDFRKVVKRKKTCGRPFNGPIQINADGRVMVCCFDFDAKMVVGDSNTEPLEKIIKGNRFERIREMHRKGQHAGLPCDTCDQLNQYDEESNPLLYSNRDEKRELGVTSSFKIKVEEN